MRLHVSCFDRRLYARIFSTAVAALALAGCAALPTIVPDMAYRHARGPQLRGAAGPLTHQQSGTILARLREHGQDTDIFSHHLARETAIVGTPLSAGNDVELLQDGPQTYHAMLRAIANAQHNIDMETYIFDDDVSGRAFAQALTERQQHGVQVNLIRDGFGTLSTPLALFRPLLDSGARIVEFNPLNPLSGNADWSLNQRDHRKLLIVDGKEAFLGGINISGVYSGGSLRRRTPDSPDAQTPAPAPWRDTDLQVRGPAVADLQRLFLAQWRDQKGAAFANDGYFPTETAAGDDVVRVIGSGPDEPFSLIYATLLSAINSAETSVHLTNAYFVPDPQMLAALESAAARGVDVVLILPSETDSWLVLQAGRSYYTELLRAGVHIFERRGVVLHSKTVLIDGVWATVGSTNLDWRSFLYNHELNAVVLGTKFGTQVQAMFTHDLQLSDRIDPAGWRGRSLVRHVQERFARLWAYWL